MKKKSLTNIIRASCVCLLVAAILVGVFTAPGGKVSGYNASFIQKLENAPKLDLQDYLNNSVAFQLPDTVKDDDQISVIITVDVANLMDSYEAAKLGVYLHGKAGDAAAKAKSSYSMMATDILDGIAEVTRL